MTIFDYGTYFLKDKRKLNGAEAGIFDKLKPAPHKNRPAPQHWF
jgi:hypothetical protein